MQASDLRDCRQALGSISSQAKATSLLGPDEDLLYEKRPFTVTILTRASDKEYMVLFAMVVAIVRHLSGLSLTSNWRLSGDQRCRKSYRDEQSSPVSRLIGDVLSTDTWLRYLESGEHSVARPWVWIVWLFLAPTLHSVAFQWYIYTSVSPPPHPVGSRINSGLYRPGREYA